MNTLRRLTGVLRGDGDTLNVLARSGTATGQAVAISALAFAVGQYARVGQMSAFVLGAVQGVVGLVTWTVVLWWNGRLVGGKAGFLPILRCTGFSAAPFALAGIPVIRVAALVYVVAIQVAVVKHVHGVSTSRSIPTVVLPWLVLVIAIGAILQADITLPTP